MPNPIRGYFTVFASRALRTGYPQELFDEARALLAKASPEDLRGSGLLGLCAKDGTEHRGAPGFTGDPWGRAPAPMAADGSLMLCEDATAPNLRVLARKSPEAGAALMALPAAIDKIFGFGPDHFDESSHQRPWSSAELWMERWLPGFGAMLAQGLPAILERLLATGKASSFAMACVKTANLPLLNRCAQAGLPDSEHCC